MSSDEMFCEDTYPPHINSNDHYYVYLNHKINNTIVSLRENINGKVYLKRYSFTYSVTCSLHLFLNNFSSLSP